MKSIANIGLPDVQAVYGGPEGELWELIMGEQVHLGGFQSSMDLAKRAGLGEGMCGVDLGCCTGAGMRFLVRFFKVQKMTGVDATAKVVEQGRARCAQAGLADRIHFQQADVCDSGLPAAAADFVWGEDAWCYVADKNQLVREAARLVKPGGVIAFTDWIIGPSGLNDAEAERYLKFMKFPNVLDLDEYCRLLGTHGCPVQTAENTGRFAPAMDLYLDMVGQQLTYDVLRIIGFDMATMEGLAGEMQFMQQLAHEGKIAQGLFIARKQ